MDKNLDIDRILRFLDSKTQVSDLLKDRLYSLEYNINKEYKQKTRLYKYLFNTDSKQMIRALKFLNQKELSGYKNFIIYKILEELSHEKY